ncbi:YadA-like family protein [Acinetobacter courvalinii]|uniref:YadA-like family protein n=1 Tax=Acinetobacter courvalinii TaxID=280147 RepID=UPI00353080CB
MKAGDVVDIGTADGEENLQVTKEGNDIKYSLNRDLKVDSVTAGDTVINNDGMTIADGPSVTKSGIDAAGTKVTNVADGTEASDAVNKGQLDQASQDLTDKGFGLTAQDGGTVQKKLGEAVEVIGADSNISTKVQDGKIAVELSRDLDVDSVTAGDTVMNSDGVSIADGPSMTKSGIDAAGNKIINVAEGDINPDSKDAINGSQLANNAQSVADALGGGSTVNPDGTVSNPTYNINGTDTANVGDALAELDKGWTLQSNGANDGAVRAGDVVDIGTADGEENLQVTKEGNDIKYSLNRDLKVDSVTAGDTVINNDGMTIADGPSVTKTGIDAAGNKITNLAPGTDGTDAVNKDQLDQVAQDADDKTNRLGESTASGLGGGSSYDPETGTVSNPTYNINGTDTNNVGDALAELDKGWTLQSNGANDGAVKAGDVVDIGTADGEENLQVTKEGNDIKYSLNRDLKVDSVTAGDTVINNNGMTITGGPSVTKSGIDVAGNKISNLAPGTEGTDAVNKDQLDTVVAASKTEVEAGKNITVDSKTGDDGQTIYTVATADDVEFDSVKVGDVNIDGATGKISGVAAGDVNPDSTDAINGSQLANNAQSVADALGGGSTVNPDGTVSNPTYNINGTDTANVGDALAELDKGWTLQSNGANEGAVRAGDVVDIGTADGEENLQVTKEGNDIKYSLNRDLKVDSVTAGDTVMNNDGMTITGGPSVTKSGIDAAGNKITNLAPGTDGTDAVNKDQLDQVVAGNDNRTSKLGETTAGALGGGATYDPTTGAISNPTYNINGKDTSNVGDALAELDKGWTLQSNGANAGAVKAGDPVDIGTAEGEENLQVSKEGNDIKYSLNRDLNVDSVTAGNTRLDNTGVEVKDPVGNSTTLVAGGTIVQDAQGNTNANTAAGTTIKNAQGDTTLLNTTGLAFTNATGDLVGPSVSRTGVDAGGLKVTNVAEGEVAADSKDAINGSQLNDTAGSVGDILGGGVTNEGGKLNGPFTVNDKGYDTVADAIQGEAAAAKTEVEAGKNMTVDSKTGDDGQTIYTVATADDVEFNTVKVGDVNIDGTTGKISGVAAGDVNPDSTDAINSSQLANNAQSVADALGGGSTVNPDGTVSNPTYNINGTDTANVGDALAELDKGWTLQSNGANDGAVRAGDVVDIGTADGEENLQVTKEGNDIKYSLNRDLKVDSVTAGDTVINNDGMTITDGPSVTKSGIDAGGKKLTNVAPGTVSSDSTDAINGSQLHAQGEGVRNIIGGDTVYDPNTGGYTNSDIGGTGEDNINDAIGSIGKAAAAAKTEVDAGKNITVESATGDDGQTIYTVATADDVEFNTVKVGDVNIDGATGKISGVAAGDVNPDSTDAINGSQLANNAQSVADALGGGSTVNPDGTVSKPNYTVNGTDLTNVGDAITELDKGWTLQSNGANDGAVRAGDVVDIGTADGEENLQVSKEGNDIKYSLNRDLKVDSVTAGDTVINNDGMTIAGGPSVTKAGIDAGGKKLTNVAPGTVSADSTDAINGSQLHAQGEGVKDIIGGNTQYDPNTGRYTNPDIGGTGEDNINDAIGAVGAAAKAAKTTVTEGDNMVVTETKNADGSTNYEVATAKDVKFDSVTATDDEGNETVLTATGTQVKDGEGNEAEYGAKGISLKDADGNGTVVNSTGLGFVDPMGNNIGPSITAKGIDAGNTVITGVAPGRVAADSQDAINGSQLKGVSDSVAGAIGGNTTVNPDGTLNTSNIGGTGKDNIHDAIGAVGDAAKAAKSTVTEGKNIVVKESKNADGSTDYEVSTTPDLEVDSVTAGGTKLDGDGLHIDGGPSVTKDGIDAGDKKVTGVADGTIADGSKDAVNGGQIKDISDSVAGAIGGNTTVNDDGTISTSNIGGTGHNNINDAIGAVGDAAKAAKSSVSNEDKNITVKESKKADGSTDYEVGLAKDITVDSVTAKDVNANQVNVAGDQGSTTITGGGISIAGPNGEAGPSMTTGGINAGGKKVTGVADGAIHSASKDAVNGSQLHQSYQDVGAALGGGAGYDPEKGWTGPTYNVAGGTHNNVGDALGAIDDRVTNLGDQMQQVFYDTNKRMDKLEDRMSAGIAATAALENAPYVAGKLTMAAGAAYYNDQSAVGVTFRRTADNGRWSLTTGAAMGSEGNSPLVRIGVSTVID